MYEVDFLPVGDGKDSGDAIAIRITRPDTGAHAVIVIDAGFEDDGEALVQHIKRYYHSDTVDLAILTHPDRDHIGGMGEVVRGLNVRKLWLHQIGAHGGSSLPAAAAVEDLIGVALDHGTEVLEAWPGATELGGAITVLGPEKAYYEELVAEQVEGVSTAHAAKAVLLSARGLLDRFINLMPIEIPFAEKDVSPRNNTSIITLLELEGRRLLFTGDAGVPALDRAWDFAEANGLGGSVTFVQIPHHGSRRNASSSWLDRLLGETGQSSNKTAFVSCVANSDKHPSGKVVNAYIRRGCDVSATAGNAIQHGKEAPARIGWGPITPLGPMHEDDDD